MPKSKRLHLLEFNTLIVVVTMTAVIVTTLGHGLTRATAKDAAWGLGVSLMFA